MNFEEKPFTVQKLADAWHKGLLLRNEEYQRGEAWTPQQKQALVDSILRGYPIPSFFFEERVEAGLDDTPTKKWEIVDGQQRIIAIADYLSGKFDLLPPTDKRLRLPLTMRTTSVTWAGRRFADLDDNDRERLVATPLNVYVISDVTERDQIRDLFIRLQSGTALTRQQIRDAWPGNMGPLIEEWAGKLKIQPALRVFAYVDKRSTRDDEGDSRDPYVKQRTTCAQVLCILLGRIKDPIIVPNVGANDLDALYHEYTDFDRHGETAIRLKAILEKCDETCKTLDMKYWGRKKLAKQALFALAMFFQDVLRNPLIKFDLKALFKLAHYVVETAPKPGGKSTSGSSIRDYYESWRASLPDGVGIVLDSKRDFDTKQKKQIFESAKGVCALCEEPVEDGEAEYDHFPIAWRDGGRTLVENGRLVCTVCHPRGRPPTPELADFSDASA